MDRALNELNPVSRFVALRAGRLCELSARLAGPHYNADFYPSSADRDITRFERWCAWWMVFWHWAGRVLTCRCIAFAILDCYGRDPCEQPWLARLWLRLACWPKYEAPKPVEYVWPYTPVPLARGLDLA